MSHRPSIALVRTTTATVLPDYRRLLGLLAAPGALRSIGTVAALGHAGHALPGERAEPWQLDGTLRALAEAGAPTPAVLLPATSPADPLVGVARAAGAVTAREIGAGALMLCGAAQAIELVERTLAGARPGLCVVDAVTLRGAPGDAAQLVVRGALLASEDPLALAALLAALAGKEPLRDVPLIASAHRRGLGCGDLDRVDLLGDTAIALERWSQPALARRPALDRLLDGLAPLAGLAAPPARRAYEDWIFYTSWGRLFRDYQRQALADSR